MPIPDADQAIVSPEKIQDYLLNREHPDGGSKAIWFESLGYELSAWQTLANDLLEVARTCEQFDTAQSVYGVKYLARGTISRADQRVGCVLTVWIVEDNTPPRLVTAYPDASS